MEQEVEGAGGDVRQYHEIHNTLMNAIPKGVVASCSDRELVRVELVHPGKCSGKKHLLPMSWRLPGISSALLHCLGQCKLPVYPYWWWEMGSRKCSMFVIRPFRAAHRLRRPDYIYRALSRDVHKFKRAADVALFSILEGGRHCCSVTMRFCFVPGFGSVCDGCVVELCFCAPPLNPSCTRNWPHEQYSPIICTT